MISGDEQGPSSAAQFALAHERCAPEDAERARYLNARCRLEDGDESEQHASPVVPCACGCGATFPASNSKRKYATYGCRFRVHNAKRKEAT